MCAYQAYQTRERDMAAMAGNAGIGASAGAASGVFGLIVGTILVGSGPPGWIALGAAALGGAAIGGAAGAGATEHVANSNYVSALGTCKSECEARVKECEQMEPERLPVTPEWAWEHPNDQPIKPCQCPAGVCKNLTNDRREKRDSSGNVVTPAAPLGYVPAYDR